MVQQYLVELLTAVSVLTLSVLTMLVKSTIDYVSSKRKEVLSRVKSEKIRKINDQVQENVELAFQSFIVSNNLVGEDGKLKEGYLQQMQQSAVSTIVKSVRSITNEGIIEYSTKEHIQDFDKWIESKVETLIKEFEQRYSK